MTFTSEQLERYSRQIILKEIGVKGQKKLLNGKVDLVSSRILPHSLGFAHRVCKEAVAV